MADTNCKNFQFTIFNFGKNTISTQPVRIQIMQISAKLLPLIFGIYLRVYHFINTFLNTLLNIFIQFFKFCSSSGRKFKNPSIFNYFHYLIARFHALLLQMVRFFAQIQEILYRLQWPIQFPLVLLGIDLMLFLHRSFWRGWFGQLGHRGVALGLWTVLLKTWELILLIVICNNCNTFYKKSKVFGIIICLVQIISADQSTAYKKGIEFVGLKQGEVINKAQLKEIHENKAHNYVLTHQGKRKLYKIDAQTDPLVVKANSVILNPQKVFHEQIEEIREGELQLEDEIKVCEEAGEEIKRSCHKTLMIKLKITPAVFYQQTERCRCSDNAMDNFAHWFIGKHNINIPKKVEVTEEYWQDDCKPLEELVDQGICSYVEKIESKKN